MPRNSLRETQRASRKSQQIWGPKPWDYELGSLESRAAARAMYDAQPIEEYYKRILFGERAGGEVVRLFIGERGQVLRTEAHRGDEWVRVEHAPKPLAHYPPDGSGWQRAANGWSASGHGNAGGRPVMRVCQKPSRIWPH
jgi:hypothetical protein